MAHAASKNKRTSERVESNRPSHLQPFVYSFRGGSGSGVVLKANDRSIWGSRTEIEIGALIGIGTGVYWALERRAKGC